MEQIKNSLMMIILVLTIMIGVLAAKRYQDTNGDFLSTPNWQWDDWSFNKDQTPPPQQQQRVTPPPKNRVAPPPQNINPKEPDNTEPERERQRRIQPPPRPRDLFPNLPEPPHRRNQPSNNPGCPNCPNTGYQLYW